MVHITERAEYAFDYGGGFQGKDGPDAEPRADGQGGAEHGAPGGGGQGEEPGLLATRGRSVRGEGEGLQEGLLRSDDSLQTRRACSSYLDEQ